MFILGTLHFNDNECNSNQASMFQSWPTLSSPCVILVVFFYSGFPSPPPNPRLVVVVDQVLVQAAHRDLRMMEKMISTARLNCCMNS